MSMFKKMISVFIVANFIVTPSLAQTMTAADSEKVQAYKDYFEPKGYKVNVEQNRAVVKDSLGQELIEWPFENATRLRQYSPDNFNQRLIDELVRAKAAENFANTKNKASGVGSAVKAGFSHAYHKLPGESAVFFMAMGAVVAGQLITNYSANPVGMKHHLDHQLSPLGVFGFYTFMATQGVTSNVLAMYMQNPKFQFLIPHLGMAVGAFVQSYLTQVLSDPNVMACAKVMMGGKVSEKEIYLGADPKPCDKAYEYLVIQKQIFIQAPTLISMLLSGVAGGYLLKGAGIVANKAAGSILRFAGVEIATLIVPGGLQVKALRVLLTKGLNIGVFVSMDMYLNSKITAAWKNYWDGADFYKVSYKITNEIYEHKKNGWNKSNASILSGLAELHKKSTEWRMMNLTDVYQSHQNWSEMLHQLTAMYEASHGFYDAFVNEVRDSKSGRLNRPLNVTYPLNGVIAKGMTGDKVETYFTHPKNDSVEGKQAETVNDVVAYIDNNLRDQIYEKMSFRKDMIEKIRAARNMMASENIDKKGEGIAELIRIYKEDVDNMHSFAEFAIELDKIINMLGSPAPMLEIGRGFGATYEKSPTHAESIKDVNFYRNAGAFTAERITDYFTMQMICGPDPDAKQSSIRSTSGYPALFLPPRINVSTHYTGQYCNWGGKLLPAQEIYRWPLSIENKEYKGVLNYLKLNVRASVLGQGEASNFQNWWKAKTESQMIAAFNTFSDSYQAIVAKLMTGIFKTEKSNWNRGPMKNGAIQSIYQEARFYSSILGEMLRDLHQKQRNADIPDQYLASQVDPYPFLGTQEDRSKPNTWATLALLSDYPLVKFKAVPSTEPQKVFTSKQYVDMKAKGQIAPRSKAPLYMLAAQAELESGLNDLKAMLGRIKVKQVPKSDSLWNKAKGSIGMGTREVIESALENYQLEEQVEKIQVTLKKFADLMGISKVATQANECQDNIACATLGPKAFLATTQGTSPQQATPLVTLTDSQRAIAVTCLEYIQAAASEMMSYGVISNAVSWAKINNLKRLDTERDDAILNKMQTLLKRMRSNTVPGKY